jgi:thymidylate kinase
VILGPDGAGKSSVILGLIYKLSESGQSVKMRHLKPRLVSLLRSEPGLTVVEPHGKPPRTAVVSIVKILLWLVEEWQANLFQDDRAALLICDRYYHDLLIDPKRYRYGGPVWVAKLVGKLMPRPSMWILLDAPAAVLQRRKQEVPFNETARQRLAYLTFIEKQQRYAVVNAAQPLEKVIADAENAIKSAMIKNDGNRGAS